MAKKQKNDDAQGSDFGTPEVQKQGGGITLGYTPEGGKIATLLEASHLAYLLNRGSISPKQALAGEYFFKDALIAGKVPYVRSCCDREIRSTGNNLSDIGVDAAISLEKAIMLLSSKEYDLIFRVVIKGEAVGAEGTKWREVKTNMQVLCGALDSLVKYYKI